MNVAAQFSKRRASPTPGQSLSVRNLGEKSVPTCVVKEREKRWRKKVRRGDTGTGLKVSQPFIIFLRASGTIFSNRLLCIKWDHVKQ